MAKTPAPHTDGFCFCGQARGAHIGDKPCTRSEPRQARGLYDLPIFGRMWVADGADLRA